MYGREMWQLRTFVCSLGFGDIREGGTFRDGDITEFKSVRAFDFLPKNVPMCWLTWFVRICVKFYFLGVGLMQIWADHETLHVVCHVGIHVDFSSMIISLDPCTLTFYCGVDLDNLGLFDQWEILECNDHGPSVSCVKCPLLSCPSSPHQSIKFTTCVITVN